VATEQAWTYTATFNVTQQVLAQAEAHLLLTGVDTFARILLNGKPAGSAQNLFREYLLPVTGLLVEGSNSLSICISPAIQAAADAKARYPYELPAVTAPGGQQQRERRAHRAARPQLLLLPHCTALSGGCSCSCRLPRCRAAALACLGRRCRTRPLPPSSSPAAGQFDTYHYVRKTASDFGWDWGPAFAPAGVSGRVALVAASRPHLRGLLVRQRHDRGNGTVLLLVECHIRAPAGGRRRCSRAVVLAALLARACLEACSRGSLQLPGALLLARARARRGVPAWRAELLAAYCPSLCCSTPPCLLSRRAPH
jgi:hypothetical protein